MSATWTATATAWTATAPAAVVAKSTLVATAGAKLTTEDIQFVNNADHAVAVDGVGAGVTSLEGVDGAADVALLFQNVVPLEGNGQRAVLEE